MKKQLWAFELSVKTIVFPLSYRHTGCVVHKYLWWEKRICFVFSPFVIGEKVMLSLMCNQQDLVVYTEFYRKSVEGSNNSGNVEQSTSSSK